MNPYQPPKSETEVIYNNPTFIFDINGTTITARGDKFSGKEQILINGELKSEKKTLAKVSEHNIEFEGQSYRIVFQVHSILTGRMNCDLFIDDEHINSLKLTMVRKNSIPVLVFLTATVTAFFIGYFQVQLNLPNEIHYILIFIAAFSVLKIMGNVKYSFEPADNK